MSYIIDIFTAMRGLAVSIGAPSPRASIETASPRILKQSIYLLYTEFTHKSTKNSYLILFLSQDWLKTSQKIWNTVCFGGVNLRWIFLLNTTIIWESHTLHCMVSALAQINFLHVNQKGFQENLTIFPLPGATGISLMYY